MPERRQGRTGWLRGHLVFGAYRSAAALAGWLPAPVAATAAVGVGWCAARVLRRRRRVVARTLSRVTGGHLRGRELAHAVDMVFLSYARYWLETFRLTGATRDLLDQGTEIRGLAHLDTARSLGRGVVLVTPHLGGWDFGGAWLASHGYPITTVVEALASPALFEWFARLRRGLGVEVVAHGADTLETLRRALACGRVVALVCDRDLGRRGVPVELFGEPTTLPAGPARLALEEGAPLLAAAVYFAPAGGHKAVIRPPIHVPRTGEPRTDVAALTQAIAAELEALIAASPTQWHLMQPNWPADEGPSPKRHRTQTPRRHGV